MYFKARPEKRRSDIDVKALNQVYIPGDDIFASLHPLRQRRPASCHVDTSVSHRELEGPDSFVRADNARRLGPEPVSPSARPLIGHQASLRSLLSVSEFDSRDMEAEIMRQIADEGLLDGVDLSRLDDEQEEEITEMIAQAYRRRKREQSPTGPTADLPDSHPSGSITENPFSHPHQSSHAPQPSLGDHLSASSLHLQNLSGNVGNDVSGSPTSGSETSTPFNTEPGPRSPSALPTQVLNSTHIHRVDTQNHTPALPFLRLSAPAIECAHCSRSRIEYDLHFECQRCNQGNFVLCLPCYRVHQGFLVHHIDGGDNGAGDNRISRLSVSSSSRSCAHQFVPKRYRGLAEARAQHTGPVSVHRNQSLSNDASRGIETGLFCDICFTLANDCYWKCEICNGGLWGFCNSCLSKSKHCTHPLIPLRLNTTPDDFDMEGVIAQELGTILTEATSSSHPFRLGDIKVLTLVYSCSICHEVIPPTISRLHCPQCRDGEFHVCKPCYRNLSVHGHSPMSPDHVDHWKCPVAPEKHTMSEVIFGLSTDKDAITGPLAKFFRYCRPAIGNACSPPSQGTKVAVHNGGSRRTIEGSADRRPDSRWWWAVDGEINSFSPSCRPASPSLSLVAIDCDLDDDNRRGDIPWSTNNQNLTLSTWGWQSQASDVDENSLTFPPGAEIIDIRPVNKEWCLGTYGGKRGVFPIKLCPGLDIR